MNYSKPQVTIDLDEYLNLKKQVEVANSDEYILMAKKTLAAFMNHKGDTASIVNQLKKEGIAFSVVFNRTSLRDKIDYQDIFIEKLT